MGTSSHSANQSLNTLETLFLRAFAISAGWMVVTSAIYLFWQFPAWLAWVSVIMAVLGFACWSWPILIVSRTSQVTKLGTGWPLALVAAAADLLIIFTLFSVRTDEGIISPWQVVPLGVFLLFALSTTFALLAFRNLERPWALMLAIVHTFCAYSVSLLVYKLGFGFDPFVHEATVRYIIEQGAITPKQPFYTGQYVLVTAIHYITTMSIATIQGLLVPLLASVCLPVLLHLHYQSMRIKHLPFWILWILPFAYFTFTVPFNLAMIGLVACLLILPLDTSDARITRVLIALATLAIHPLIGIPCLALVAAVEVERWRPKLAVPALFLATVGGLFGSLAFYASRNGGLMTLPPIDYWIPTLQLLFYPTFQYIYLAPWWTALYVFYYLWPWVLTLLGSVGLVLQWRRTKSRRWLLPLASAFGILLTAILSAATIRYQNIITHEQFEFALRLIALLPWIVMPGLFFFADRKSQIAKLHLPIIFVIVFLATAIWHSSYPQLNPVMHVSSAGVSRTDFLTVEAIESLADGRPYVALVPQLTSAAALRELGFGRSVSTRNGPVYPYAIPTGGELYRSYEGLLMGADVTSTIEQVRGFAPTPILYVAVPIAWDNGELDTALKNIAKKWVFIDESMRVYEIVNTP
ncbi:hypothetical protein K8R04_04515 [Candidatus Uhrbacteria bacterium]|nr:hypothetical protein [Candidatus Uhrbacteria bacterium]